MVLKHTLDGPHFCFIFICWQLKIFKIVLQKTKLCQLHQKKKVSRLLICPTASHRTCFSLSSLLCVFLCNGWDAFELVGWPLCRGGEPEEEHFWRAFCSLALLLSQCHRSMGIGSQSMSDLIILSQCEPQQTSCNPCIFLKLFSLPGLGACNRVSTHSF